MILFQLTLLPLLMITILLAHEPKAPQVKKFLENAVWGVRTFIVALVFYIILFVFMNKSYTTQGVYFYHVIHDYLFWGIFFLAGYLLLYKRESRPHNVSTQELFAFALGFYLFTGVVDGIVLFGEYDVYNLFLLPLVRGGLLAGCVYLVSFGRSKGGRLMILTPIFAGAVFFLGGIPALLFYIGYPVTAVILSIILTAGGIIPYLIHRIKGESLLFS